MVEWRWSLKPLQPRDTAAQNLAEVLDFTYHNPSGPITAITDPGPHVCKGDNSLGSGPATTSMATSDEFWYELRDSPLLRSWPSAR
jgi:phospholipase C